MSDVINETVAMVEQKEQELIQLKRAVNTFCQMKGLPPRYGDSDLRASGGGVIREDQFYGKPLAAVVREYLQSQGHAVPAAEIVAALERGGFDFDAMGWKEQYRERSLINSLVKNPKYFHRLPNGTFGLPDFYPNLPKREKPEKPEEAEEEGGEAEAKPDTEPAAVAVEDKTKARKTKTPQPARTGGAAS